MDRDTETIVLSRPDRLGDLVIATSVIRPLVEQTGARVLFAARRLWLPLLLGNPLLAGCVDVDDAPDVLAEKIRRVRPASIIHMNPHEAMYRAGQAAGIPTRIGYPLASTPEALTAALPDRRRAGGRHEAEFDFDLVGRLGVAAPPRPRPELYLPEASLRSLERTLGRRIEDMEPYVVLHPSAYLSSARWPPRHFRALARLIREHTSWRIILTGHDARDRGHRRLVAWLGDKALDLGGRTGVAEMGWLIRHAAGVVTRDTGPSHVAGALGTPTVVICGRTEPVYSPVRWGALGPRVELVVRSLPRRRFERKEWNWRRSFAAITPDEVFAALVRVTSRA